MLQTTPISTPTDSLPSSTETLKYYGKEYIEEYLKKPTSRIERLLKYFEINKNDSVLDVGCGTAMLYEVIGDKIRKYTGIDFSDQFIMVAKNRFDNRSNTNFWCCDVVNFCNNCDEKFDKIFLLDYTEHVSDPDLKKILIALKNNLDLNASIFIHAPNKDYFLEILKEKGILKQFESHIAVRNAEDYLKLLQNVGFKTIKTHYIPHYNIMKYLHILSYLPFVGKFFNARLFIEVTI